MKKLTYIFSLTALALATTSITFAKSEVNCLPPLQVANSQFVKAISSDDNPNAETVWNFISEHIHYNNQEWGVLFLASLNKTINTPEEALIAGQQLFANTSLGNPSGDYFENDLVCLYPTSSNLIVIATTPPSDNLFESTKLKFRK